MAVINALFQFLSDANDENLHVITSKYYTTQSSPGSLVGRHLNQILERAVLLFIFSSTNHSIIMMIIIIMKNIWAYYIDFLYITMWKNTLTQSH